MLEKKLRWMTLGGQYDWATKRYPSERPPAFPRDIATLLMVLFPQIRPEAAIVNLYSPGDTLSLHRDVSEQSEQDLVSAIAAKKRESIFSSFPSQWRLPGPVVSAHDQRDVSGSYLHQYLSPREIEITETDALAILERTTTGKWKSRDVVEAFCHRAALAHQLTNCLHEVFFDQALNNAEALDRHFAEHGRPVGPLHGLPVSLKDQFHVKDVETTMGYIGWIGTFQGLRGTGRERVFESELVKELRSMGAVLYCKTSVPHTLMSGETVNNIIGYTWNPKNRRLSSGGSSGGEGALLGLRGSPLGFGTDIGGSIRIPAAFNGLFGLRPSSGRLPYEGMANSMDGQNSLLSVVGPLSHSVPALRLVVRSILDQKPWFSDPMVHEIPWRVDEENRMLELIHGRSLGEPRLAFAVLRHDGIVQPQPPVRRAVGLAVRALERLGHTVFEWDPPSHRTSNDLTGAIWLLDGGNDAHASLRLSGEPISRQVAGAFGQEPKQEASASKIAVTNVAKRQWQKQYMDYWNSTVNLTGTGRPVDAVIAPVAPFAAALPEKYGYYGYTTFVNLLDYTSCVIPVTHVDKELDIVDPEYQFLNSQDKSVWESYDPDVYDGTPVAIQVIGRRLQEEKVLALSELLTDALSARGGT
ncbi:MAG: Acetamidase [Caeruleum heppii]|nr:MAG: Acetamidase [Caeruleum heppii]